MEVPFGHLRRKASAVRIAPLLGILQSPCPALANTDHPGQATQKRGEPEWHVAMTA